MHKLVNPNNCEHEIKGNDSYEIKEMREFYDIYRNNTLSKCGGAKADPTTEQART
jgi:hypothetical protein